MSLQLSGVIEKIITSVCVVTIIAVVGFEAATSAIRGTEFLSFYVVVLLVIFIFVAVGERITKMAISVKDGFFVEQSVQRDVQRFEEMGLALIVYRDGPSLSSLNALLPRLDEKGRDAWSKLIIIRLSLRATLRGLSKPYDPNLSESASLSGMLRLIKSKSVIGEEGFRRLGTHKNCHVFCGMGRRGSAIVAGCRVRPLYCPSCFAQISSALTAACLAVAAPETSARLCLLPTRCGHSRVPVCG